MSENFNLFPKDWVKRDEDEHREATETFKAAVATARSNADETIKQVGLVHDHFLRRFEYLVPSFWSQIIEYRARGAWQVFSPGTWCRFFAGHEIFKDENYELVPHFLKFLKTKITNLWLVFCREQKIFSKGKEMKFISFLSLLMTFNVEAQMLPSCVRSVARFFAESHLNFL